MKHAQRLGLAAALACIAAVATALPGAEAQLKKAPVPVGAWDFKTESMGAGCTLTGDMTVYFFGDGGTAQGVDQGDVNGDLTAGQQIRIPL